MLIEYLKMVLRNYKKNKIYFAINITGLAIGLAVSFMALIYVLDETNYDKMNVNYNNIFRIVTNYKTIHITGGCTPLILRGNLKQNFPAVSEAARVTRNRTEVKKGDKYFSEKNFVYADKEIFNVFTLPLLKGNIENIFSDPNSIVVSEKIKDEYFGVNEPVGSWLSIKLNGGEHILKVTGVIKNIPHNSTFAADFIAPIAIYQKEIEKRSGMNKIPACFSWGWSGCSTYLLLKDGVDKNQIEKSIRLFTEKNQPEKELFTYSLQPLSQVYFHSADFIYDNHPRGNLKYVNIISAIAFLIILLACINYILLSTAISLKQVKEIGIRKLIGATRGDLIKQVLFQSAFTSLLALPPALIIVEYFLSFFGNLIDKNMTPDFFHSAGYFLCFISIDLLAGVLSGVYVAIYLSGLNALEIVKKKFIIKNRRFYAREILVCLQMLIFISLIFFSLIINKQLKYCLNNYSGFDKTGILVIEAGNAAELEKAEYFKNRIMSCPGVLKTAECNDLPLAGGSMKTNRKLGNKENAVPFTEDIEVDYNYFDLLNLKILKGRNFSKEFSADKNSSVIINETAAREMDTPDPVGKTIGKFTVIGVVNDYNTQSYHEKINPLVIHLASGEETGNILVKIKPENMAETVALMNNQWKEIFGGNMQYAFFDDIIKNIYDKDNRFLDLINYSMFFSVFISVLGLFGLSLFIAESKVKDASIRKVFGASMFDIIGLLLKDYVKLVIISCIIALPISYYIAVKWLENFAYKTTQGIDVFVTTCILTALITLITVSWQCLKVARSNQITLLNSQ